MEYEIITKTALDSILVQISLARSQKIDDEAHNMLNSAQLLILENRITINGNCHQCKKIVKLKPSRQYPGNYICVNCCSTILTDAHDHPSPE